MGRPKDSNLRIFLLKKLFILFGGNRGRSHWFLVKVSLLGSLGAVHCRDHSSDVVPFLRRKWLFSEVETESQSILSPTRLLSYFLMAEAPLPFGRFAALPLSDLPNFSPMPRRTDLKVSISSCENPSFIFSLIALIVRLALSA